MSWASEWQSKSKRIITKRKVQLLYKQKIKTKNSNNKIWCSAWSRLFCFLFLGHRRGKWLSQAASEKQQHAGEAGKGQWGKNRLGLLSTDVFSISYVLQSSETGICFVFYVLWRKYNFRKTSIHVAVNVSFSLSVSPTHSYMNLSD